jgi:signal transduction histidine kinase
MGELLGSVGRLRSAAAWPQRAARHRYGPAFAAGAAAFAGVGESIARTAGAAHFASGPGVYELLLVLTGLATTLPLALRRDQPAVATLITAGAGQLSLWLFGLLTIAGAVTLLALLCLLAVDSGLLLPVGLAATFLVPALAGAAPGWPAPDAETRTLLVLVAVLAPAAALAGALLRSRAEAQRNAAAREVIAGTLLEHTARGERVRITRELHDVVAHHISMVAVQAETARLATPGMPAAGQRQLLAIGDTARAALTEMRRLLGVLREDAAAGSDGPWRQPQPGLEQLNELLDEARDASAGALRLIISGPPRALDPGVELTAYRIIQEALTNCRRHAPGAAVDVELRYGSDSLRVRVRDNGPGGAGVSGHGLLGMRERAAAVGGELCTGSATSGGFLVEARLPTSVGVPL